MVLAGVHTVFTIANVGGDYNHQVLFVTSGERPVSGASLKSWQAAEASVQTCGRIAGLHPCIAAAAG